MKFTYNSGQRPLDGYTIKRGVGRGGFGEVYYAVSDGGKEVALKLVRGNQEVELRGMAQCLNLKHPNLVSRVTFTKAPAPELPGKIKAMQGAKRVDIDLVLTGTDGLSAGIQKGLWYNLKPYRARAVAEPRAVLAEFGTIIPDDVEVRVSDSTAMVRFLVIPRRPAGTADLSRAAASVAISARASRRR